MSASRAAALLALAASSACIHQGRLAPMAQRGLPLVTTEAASPAPDGEGSAADDAGSGEAGGVRHLVRPGETLWRIARAYSVPVADLQRANGLSDPSQLEAGARLLIPGADRERTVRPADGPQARVEPRPGHRASPAQIPRAGGHALDPAAGGEPLAWPVRGVLISGFGVRDREHHDGIDLACPEGAPVFAAGEGEVLFAGEQRGYGNLVLVGHPHGVVTVYAHNLENLVVQGDRVLRGEPIARVGRTGKATGPHLHFEVRVGSRPRDPLGFLR
ncbi:MAG: peptidoglycan DD-metalloendopeptidase family protein [Myxococcales bacterium]